MQDVPANLEQCESCREVDCTQERWESCRQRLDTEAAMLRQGPIEQRSVAAAAERPPAQTEAQTDDQPGDPVAAKAKPAC